MKLKVVSNRVVLKQHWDIQIFDCVTFTLPHFQRGLCCLYRNGYIMISGRTLSSFYYVVPPSKILSKLLRVSKKIVLILSQNRSPETMSRSQNIMPRHKAKIALSP